MNRRRWAACLGAALCLAAAADPAGRLTDPAKEARARALFRETRCVVCQGESIDESEAPLAGDLRAAIRRQLRTGASDAQVRAFLARRYGEFVLFRPPLTPLNAILWGGPFVIMLGGLWLLLARRPVPADPGLSPDEEARLATLGPDTAASDTFTPELSSKNAAGITER